MSTKNPERWWVVSIRNPRTKGVSQVTVRADSEADARVLACVARGDAILKVVECGKLNARLTSWSYAYIPTTDLYEALGDCASLLKVGVPFQEALKLQLSKVKSPALRYELYAITQILVNKGASVPDAFKLRPRICDAHLESIIRVGFEAGSMVESFHDMRSKTRKDRRFTGKLRGALMQPGITVMFLVLLTVFFCFAIIPRIEQIYHDFHKPLPAVSVPTYFFAMLMRKFALITLPAAFGIPIFLWVKRERILQVPNIRQLIYRMPKFGDFFSLVDLIGGLRNLSILLKTGVPLNEALVLTSPGFRNPRTRTAWEAINKEISTNGVDASIAFERYAADLGTEGPTIAAIVRIGEQGANLPQLLVEKAIDYTSDIDDRLEDVVKMIGPLVNVVIFVVAGWFLMTTYLPILKINSVVAGITPPGPPVQVIQTPESHVNE